MRFSCSGSLSVVENMVIFKEDGVVFPTDFRDIGQIVFEKDKPETKASELFKGLIEFGILKMFVA